MTKKEILSVKVHRFWNSTVPITYHMQDLTTCTARGQVCSMQSRSAILLTSPHVVTKQLWDTACLVKCSCANRFRHIHCVQPAYTQTHSKYRSGILIILILQQHRAPNYKHSNMKWSDGQPIRFKLLDSIHILQETNHSLIVFHFRETLPNN
jgi:hypothetical protein